MSKVERLKAELQTLSPAELKRVRDWLNDFLEDRLGFTPGFEVTIQESEHEMAAGPRPRVRKP
jgi:DNA mismatch repair protein MutH